MCPSWRGVARVEVGTTVAGPAHGLGKERVGALVVANGRGDQGRQERQVAG